MISAIIITKNEEEHIQSMISQLSWVDEIIVVDNDSADQTVRKALDMGAKAVRVNGNDFSKLRNEGAFAAKGEWLFFIDADEEIHIELQKEIQGIVSSDHVPYSGYVIKRTNYYLGKKWPYEDGMIRLIYKPLFIEWFGSLHETAKLHGEIGELHHRLIHKTHRTLQSMVKKTNQWSLIEAKLRKNAQHPVIVSWRIWRVILTEFFHSYVYQKGWKAGTLGLVESLFQAFSVFITYAKLWEIQLLENSK